MCMFSHNQITRKFKMLALASLLFSNLAMAQSGYYSNLTGSQIKTANVSEINSAVELTYEADIYLDSLTSWTNIMGQADTSSNRTVLSMNNGQLYAIVANGSNTWVRTKLSNKLKTDKWYHVAMNYKAGRTDPIRIFVNGVRQSTENCSSCSSFPTTSPNTSASFLVGANKFNGKMDNVRVWDALVPNNTMKTWRDTTVTNAHPFASNLVLNWDFEDYLTANSVAPAPAPAQGTAYTGEVIALDYQRQLLTGYFPSYRMRGAISDATGVALAEKLTHMIYFSITTDEDGNLGHYDPATDGVTPLALTDAQAHIDRIRGWVTTAGTNTKILVTFGGGGGAASNHMNAGTDTVAKRRGIILGMKKLVLDNNLHGVDINWEGVIDVDHYQALLEEMRTLFDNANNDPADPGDPIKNQAAAPDLMITTAVNVSYYEDMANAMNQYADYTQLMTYGSVNPVAGTQFSLTQLTNAANNWITAGLDNNKLILGLPAFGRNASGEAPAALVYKSIVADIPMLQPSDDTYVYPANGLTYYFNGIDTIVNKTKYTKENGFGGVMFWEVAQDVLASDPKSLIKAANETIGVNLN